MAKKVAVFSDDELRYLRGAAHSVWDYIGGDVLNAVADEKGKDVNRVTVSRADVIELVLDASRFEEKVEADVRRGHVVATADLLARWKALDYAGRIATVKPAFSYGRYGM